MASFLPLLGSLLLAATIVLLPRAASTRPAISTDAYRLARSVASLQQAALHYVHQKHANEIWGAAAYPSAVADVAGNWFAQPAYLAPTPRLPSGMAAEFIYVPPSSGPPAVPERFYLCITGTVRDPAHLDNLLRGAAVAQAAIAGDVGCADAAQGSSGPAPAAFPVRYTFIKQLV
jgi:hypothetical protein